MADERKLKLFVVGESSGNPDDWSDENSHSLVIAENEEQAKELGGYIATLRQFAAEVDCSEPRVIQSCAVVDYR